MEAEILDSYAEITESKKLKIDTLKDKLLDAERRGFLANGLDDTRVRRTTGLYYLLQEDAEEIAAIAT